MALTISDESLESIQLSSEIREKALQKAKVGICNGFIRSWRN